MFECARGLPVTTQTLKALDAINGFTHALLAHTDTATIALEAPLADPHDALSNGVAAALMLFGENAMSSHRAAPYIEAAFANIDAATAREQMLVRAVAAWAWGDVTRALRYHNAILEQWPADALNIKLAQHHCFNRGDAAGIRWFAAQGHAHNPHCAYLQGMYAFGLEQTGDLDRAEYAARDASDREAKNPWAHHALAHVLLTKGQHLQALAFLHRKSRHWGACSSFMYTHNWWHTALAALGTNSLDGADDALALYDDHVWTRDISQIQPQVNAAGLLARLELHGVEIGSRWAPVAAKASEHLHDHIHGYLDLHFLMALLGAGEDTKAHTLTDSMQAHAHDAAARGDLTWQYIVMPAARGLSAYRKDDMREARRHLAQALPGLHRAGGSHAQRALFTDMYNQATMALDTMAA